MYLYLHKKCYNKDAADNIKVINIWSSKYTIKEIKSK